MVHPAAERGIGVYICHWQSLGEYIKLRRKSGPLTKDMDALPKGEGASLPHAVRD